MFILSRHLDVLNLWASLSITGKLYICCLGLCAAYTIYTLARAILSSKRWLKKIGQVAQPVGNVTPFTNTSPIESVRQLHLLFLLLFGATLANEGFATLSTIRHSLLSLSGIGVDAFEPCAAFAFFVSGVLAVLHVIQWVVAAQLQRNLHRALASLSG